METVWLVVSLVLVAVGVVATVMPVLPALFIILAGQLLYAWATGFTLIGVGFLLSMLFLAVVGSLADTLTAQLAAKRKGASAWGMAGALIGGIAGAFLLGPIGLVLGPLAGAFLGELAHGQPVARAREIGWQVFLGVWLGNLVKLIIGLIMAVLFIIRIF